MKILVTDDGRGFCDPTTMPSTKMLVSKSKYRRPKRQLLTTNRVLSRMKISIQNESPENDRQNETAKDLCPRKP